MSLPSHMGSSRSFADLVHTEDVPVNTSMGMTPSLSSDSLGRLSSHSSARPITPAPVSIPLPSIDVSLGREYGRRPAHPSSFHFEHPLVPLSTAPGDYQGSVHGGEVGHLLRQHYPYHYHLDNRVLVPPPSPSPYRVPDSNTMHAGVVEAAPSDRRGTSTGGQRPGNRITRVTTACDYCRKAKVGCDKMTHCGTCVRKNQQCSRTAVNKKRGPRPGASRLNTDSGSRGVSRVSPRVGPVAFQTGERGMSSEALSSASITPIITPLTTFSTLPQTAYPVHPYAHPSPSNRDRNRTQPVQPRYNPYINTARAPAQSQMYNSFPSASSSQPPQGFFLHSADVSERYGVPLDAPPWRYSAALPQPDVRPLQTFHPSLPGPSTYEAGTQMDSNRSAFMGGRYLPFPGTSSEQRLPQPWDRMP